MKPVVRYFLILVCVSFFSSAASAKTVTATYNQEHFWILDDDGAINTATGYGPSDPGADTTVSGVTGNFRMRFGLLQTASGANANLSVGPQLQYQQGSVSCTAASGWTNVANGGSCGEFCQASSFLFIDGQATTQRFSDGHTFLAGDGVEVFGSPNTINFSGSNTEHTEWEWMLMRGTAAPGTTYTFRIIYGTGTAFESYGQCATLTVLAGPADLTAAGGVTEPVAISSVADTAGERVAVFDFTLSDGTSDGKALGVSQIVVHTSGTGTPSDLTWELNGPDASYVTGTVGAGTITFSGLGISVADTASETYTVYAYYKSSGLSSTDGQTYILSVDGDTDVTVSPSGTQMNVTSPVTNGTGSTMNVVATELRFTTQPPATADINTDFTGTIGISATDSNGNVDKDFTENVTLSAVKHSDHSAGSGTLSSTDSGGLTKAAAAGAASWTDTKYSTAEAIEIKAVSASFPSGIFSSSVGVGLTTTLGNYVTGDPADTVIGPGQTAFADSFSLSTNSGTDTVTGMTVTMSPNVAAVLSDVIITSDDGLTTYCSVATTANQAFVSGCAIPVTSTPTQFKVKVTAIGHASMPPVPGQSFLTSATVTDITSTYQKAGIDAGTGDTFTKLSDPATLPTKNGRAATFSSEGRYLAIGFTATPWIEIYKRSGDTFTALADPATLPTGQGQGGSFSADGIYLAIAHDITPFVTIYKRSGDTFTKLSDPATLPAGQAFSAAFSQDGTYLAIAHSNTPFVTIYKRSGDTFTKLANPSSLPPNTGRSVAFSADGTYLAVAHTGTPFVTIYKRSGDTFTKLSDPATLPTGTVSWGVAFAPNGNYLSVTSDASPWINIYKRSADTFTKLADPGTLPTGLGYATTWSPDSVYLTVGHDITPFITIYKRNGDTFTKLSNPTLPSDMTRAMGFSPDGKYWGIGFASANWMAVYKTSTTSTALMIDNESPGEVTSASATAGNTQVWFSYTTPSDTDVASVIVLRNSSAVADTPVEGQFYSVGDAVGGSVVACVDNIVTPSTADSCIASGMTNGSAYHFKIFVKDLYGNYSATGVVPAGSPVTPAAGVNRYWVGSAGGNTNSTTNWSSFAPASCTGGGVAVPGPSDIAYFTSGCVNNATVNAAFSVYKVQMDSGYSGTITQSAAVSVGGDWSQAGGIFTGGTQSIDVGGAFSLSGGTFTSTTGTLSVGGNFSRTAGTFNASTGTVALMGTSGGLTLTSGGQTFNNLTVNGSSGTYTMQDALAVGGTLTVADGATLDVSTSNWPIVVSGNWTNSGGNFLSRGGRVLMNGAGTQTLSGGTNAFNDLYLNDGLVGYWKLDETSAGTFADQSGYAGTGTGQGAGGANNTPQPSSNMPSINFIDTRSLAFDGTDDYVQVPHSSAFDITGDITFAAWIKRGQTNHMESYLTKTDGSAWDYDFGICSSSAGDGCSGSQDKLNFYAAGMTPGYVNSTGTVADTSWHHIAFVKSGTQVTFYIDGVSSGTSTMSGTMQNHSYDIWLGKDGYSSATAGPLLGNMDDVRLYDRALTSGQIAALAAGNEPAAAASGASTTLQDALNVDGSLYLNSGNLDVKNISNYSISVGKDWWNNGAVFTPRGGTVTLDGSTAQTVLGGSSSFNNLTVTNAAGVVTFSGGFTTTNLSANPGSSFKFSNGTTMTLTGALSLDGTSSNHILLDTVSGSTPRFTIDATAGAQNVSYVTVANSEAVSNNITAANSTNGGGNDDADGTPHWIFTAVGGASSRSAMFMNGP